MLTDYIRDLRPAKWDSEPFGVAANLEAQCLLWVKSGHRVRFAPCPLYPRKRTSFTAAGMSALCQYLTFVSGPQVSLKSSVPVALPLESASLHRK